MTLGELFNVVIEEQLVTLRIGTDKKEITARTEVLVDYLIDSTMDMDVDAIIVEDGKLKVWCVSDEDT